MHIYTITNQSPDSVLKEITGRVKKRRLERNRMQKVLIYVK